MNETLFNSLASNGPWAITAGFLLYQVITAWTNDRKQITTLLTDFKDALHDLKIAVEDLKKYN